MQTTPSPLDLSALVHRDGSAFTPGSVAVIERFEKRGRRGDLLEVVLTYAARCRRCGGAGGHKHWPGFTCYDCGGSGRGSERLSLYTQAKAEALAAAEAKRTEKRMAAAAVRQAAHDREVAERAASFLAAHGALLERAEALVDPARPGFLGDLVAKLRAECTATTRQLESLTAAVERAEAEVARLGNPEVNCHVGAAGERLRALVLTVDRAIECEGFQGRSATLLIMRDGAGRAFKWFTGGCRYGRGDVLTLDGTVKDHATYDGLRQTVLTRCSVKDSVLSPRPADD